MWIENLDENRRLLAINLILARNEKQDEFSISVHADEPWSLDDTDKLKLFVIRTGKDRQWGYSGIRQSCRKKDYRNMPKEQRCFIHYEDSDSETQIDTSRVVQIE